MFGFSLVCIKFTRFGRVSLSDLLSSLVCILSRLEECNVKSLHICADTPKLHCDRLWA